MTAPAQSDELRAAGPLPSGRGPFPFVHSTRFVSLIFALLMTAQAITNLVLGTGTRGRSISAFLVDLISILATYCTWSAFRRARGNAALFWFLFTVTLTILLIPDAILAFDSLIHHSSLSDSTWRLLYCLYGAPVMMMLFLPIGHPRAQLRSETLLDLFQVGIVVSLVYSTFFFLPVRTMAPADALLRNLIVSNLHALFLLVVAAICLSFSRLPSARSLLSRLVAFLFVCAVVTFIGDWIDQHHYTSAATWFYLGWDLPAIVAGRVALTWHASPEVAPLSERPRFSRFLYTNLVLISMLVAMNLLIDRWKAAHGELLVDAAITSTLLAFTFRLALTQYHQHQEITQRQAAQAQLTTANHTISALLDDARRQTQEITQVGEFASLLQVCASQAEAFHLVPERLSRLFPGVSGGIALLSPSGNRVESAAHWGPHPSTQMFAPEQCWALRRGSTHTDPGGSSSTHCTHLLGDGPSICIPLIANGVAIGILALQNDASPPGEPEADAALARQRQVAGSAAEHIAVAIANLSLREALRLQAIRDPLTGLYNRRYMEEFLDRELHRALRKGRPLAVLMLDIDHFKRYNDTFGHAAGDKALATVGEVLLRSIRGEDIACRYGGEEFTVIMAECSLQQAVIRADDIRRRLHESHLHDDDQALPPITASVGVAAFPETTDRVDLLLKLADDALYKAKHNGRDRVATATPSARSTDLERDETDQSQPLAASTNRPS